MKLYKLSNNGEIYSTYGVIDPAFEFSFGEMDDIIPVKEKWGERELRKIEKDRDPDLWITALGILVDESSNKILEGVFHEDDVEYLPVIYQEKKLELIHVLKLDAFHCRLVHEGLDRFYVFDEEEMKSANVEQRYYVKAKYGNSNFTPVLFTEKCKQKMEEMKVKGLRFTLVWDSEENYDGR